jgi:hypothetical protein
MDGSPTILMVYRGTVEKRDAPKRSQDLPLSSTLESIEMVLRSEATRAST